MADEQPRVPTIESWTFGYHFASKGRSGKVYEALRDLIFGPLDFLDASVYRLIINGNWHVIVVGVGPPPHESATNLLQAACVWGSYVDVPEEVAAALLARRFAVHRPEDEKTEFRSGL